MSGVSKAIAKRNILFTGVAARLFVLATALFLQSGFRIDQIKEILFILLPSSAFYLTLLTIYLVKHAYRNQRAVKKLNQLYVISGYATLLTVNLAEALLIFLKALNSDNITGDDAFFNALLGTETLLAIFTAIYPANLLVVTVAQQD